jgi:hypothetical protein
VVTPVRTILRSVVQTWDLQPASRLARAREVWSRVVGETLSASSAPVSIRGTRLAVGVTHVAIGHEVRLRRSEILQTLGEELGAGAITDLVTVPRRHLKAGRRPPGGRTR